MRSLRPRRLVLLLVLASVAAIAREEAAAQAIVDPFLCAKIRLSRGLLCSADAPQNAGGACTGEADCGGAEGATLLCGPNRFPRGIEIQLENSFEAKAFRVLKPLGLCSPAELDRQPVDAPDLHLQSYRIKEARRSCAVDAPVRPGERCEVEEDCGGSSGETELCGKTPRHARRERLVISDLLGELTVDTIKPDRLLVPAAVDEASPPGASDLGAVDHYTCYKIRVSRRTPRFPKGVSVLVEDSFEETARYDLKRPTRLCVPTDEDGEGIEDAASSLTCYRVKRTRRTCTPEAPLHAGEPCRREADCGGIQGVTELCARQPAYRQVDGIYVEDPLGPARLDTLREEELCLLARILDEDPEADDDQDGFSESAGDCDDTDPAIHPGAPEVCNGTDDDCDGEVDEGDVCLIPNRPPEVTSSPVTLVLEAQPYAYDVDATDPDAGDVLTYSLPFAPTGMAIDAQTGAIAWSPGPADVGRHGVVARVEDDGGLADTDAFVLTVEAIDPNLPPVLEPIADRAIVAGAALAVQATASDPNPGDVLTFTLLKAPSGMTIDPASGAIAWTPAADQLFGHPVRIRVQDEGGLFDEEDFVVVVSVNAAPVARDDAWAVRADDVLTVAAPGVLANDDDANGDPLSAQLVDAPARGTVDLRADGSFAYTPDAPPVGTLDLVLKYRAGVLPAGQNAPIVGGNPVIVDLEGDGVAEIVAITMGAFGDTFLVAVRGDTGALVFAAPGHTSELPEPEPGYHLSRDSHLAAGDIDLDGRPEIIAVDTDDGDPSFDDRQGLELYAFEHDGTRKWTSEPVAPANGTGVGNGFRNAGATIADLDGDGMAEIVIGYFRNKVAAFDSNGSILWNVEGNGGGGGNSQMLSHVADVDLDGRPEVVYGDDVFSNTGVPLWNANVSQPVEATIANFDDDAFAEILWCAEGGSLYLHEHDGARKWGPINIPNRATCSPIAAADLNGDGRPEALFAANRRVHAVAADGSLLWQTEADSAGGGPGVTVFDLEGDGSPEVIYQAATEIVILGSDGAILRREPRTRGSRGDSYPQVADLDADGHAEIVVAAGSNTAAAGIWVYESVNDDWAPTRPIWNQHSYYVIHVNGDGTVPAAPAPHWLTPGLNASHVNRRLPREIEESFDHFTYRATDGALASNLAAVAIDVLPANDAPAILSSPPALASPDFDYRYLVRAVDPDPGEVLGFALVQAPAGMTIDPDTGLVSWTPSPADLGRHPVTLEVTDTQDESALQHFVLDVVPPVAVPDVVGLAQGDAAAALTAGALALGDVTTPSSATVPAGDVIGQDPPAGTVVAAGTPVDLAVSSGPAPVVVPDLVGLLEAAAASALAARDLVPGTVTRVNSETAPRGSVIAQDPAAGTELVSGAAVHLTVSSGPAVVIDVPGEVIAAGEELPFAVLVFDANGDPVVPPPAVDVVLVADPGEIGGAPPVLLADRVTTSADTRGVFALRATVQGTGETAEIRIVVTAPTAAQQAFRDLGQALRRAAEDLGALDRAIAEGDLAAIPALEDSLVAVRDGLELEDLRRTAAFAPSEGFLPELADVTAAGFPETPDDASFFVLTGQIIDVVESMEELLIGMDAASPFDDERRLRLRNAELAALLGQLDGLAPTVHGLVRSASRVNHLLSVRVPRLLHAQVDRVSAVLQAEGLAALAPGLGGDGALVARAVEPPADYYARSRPTFFTLSGFMSAARIQSTILNDVYKPYLIEIAKAAAVLALNDLLEDAFVVGDIDAVITGASLGLNIFGAPNSVIEGVGFAADFPEENDVLLVGPNAIDAVLDVIGTIDPSNVTNLDELAEKFAAARSAAEAAVAAFDEANSQPDDVLAGCLFNSAPGCRQLVWADGFASVHSSGSFPAPVLVIVRNVTTGLWATSVVSFLPDA